LIVGRAIAGVGVAELESELLNPPLHAAREARITPTGTTRKRSAERAENCTRSSNRHSTRSTRAARSRCWRPQPIDPIKALPIPRTSRKQSHPRARNTSNSRLRQAVAICVRPSSGALPASITRRMTHVALCVGNAREILTSIFRPRGWRLPISITGSHSVRTQRRADSSVRKEKKRLGRRSPTWFASVGVVNRRLGSTA
jgi:hypothetical protein